jgi:hypothetical protein
LKIPNKNNNKKKVGKLAQVVEHLPHTCEALISNSSTTKKKKKKGQDPVVWVIYRLLGI